MRVVVLAVLCLLLALPVLGQNADAPDPSAASSVLYAASNDAANRDVGWLSTDSTEGSTATVGGSKPQDCVVPVGGLPSPLCTGAAFDWTWTFKLSPALRGPVALDPAGKIKLVAFLGAGTGTGSLEVTSQLMQGSTVVADGAATPHDYANSPTGENYGAVVWEVPVGPATLEAGTDLVWTVRAVGGEGGSGSLFMAVGEPRGRSRIELPAVGGASTVQALTGATVDLQLSFNETTDKTLAYSWAAPTGGLRVVAKSAGVGALDFTIVDGANETLVQAPLNGTQEIQRTISGGSNWTLTLDLMGFNGTFHLTIQPAMPATTSGTATSSGAAGEGADDGHADEDADETKDTPGPSLPILLAVLTGLGALQRRRRGP